MPFAATWMDLEIIVLSEVSQRKKISCGITYMWNLKNDTNELTKQKQTQIQKTNLWSPKETKTLI